jgi:hypothetical protein
LKNKHSSVSITTANARNRAVKCYFDASADVLLNIAVISITDRLFKEEKKWYKIDSGSTDYDVWLLLFSKKRKYRNLENEKDFSSEKENRPNSNTEENENNEEFEEEQMENVNEMRSNDDYQENSYIRRHNNYD